MCRDNDTEKIYNSIEKPIIENIKNFSLNDIIDNFVAKFNHERLENRNLDDIRFYQSSMKSIKHLFEIIPFDMQKPLAVRLVQHLQENCCDGELASPKIGFFSAVINISFGYLRENDEDFKTAFCTFNGDDGVCHAFCRFVVLAALEHYCRVNRRDVADFYKTVIHFDSEVVENMKNTPEEQIFKRIWLEWCKNNRQLGINTYSKFINESYDSLYWPVRHPIRKEILI